MKIIKVESCDNCPLLEVYCNHCVATGIAIKDTSIIPDWCPLLDTKDIVEKHPLTSGYATDARYVWPERWKEIEEIEDK